MLPPGQFSAKGYFDTRLPGQSYFGAEPVALALNAAGNRLYVANAASDAIAVIDTQKLTARASKQGMVEPTGFVPTDWMPISMAFIPSSGGGKLYVATAKGKGTGPNNFPQRSFDAQGNLVNRATHISEPFFTARLPRSMNRRFRTISRNGLRSSWLPTA